MRAIPECIIEYDTVNGGDETPISVDDFNRRFRLFWNDRDYTVNEYAVPDGHVYAVFYTGCGYPRVSSCVWHVPAGF